MPYDFSYVTLVDRAGLGGVDIIFDGQVIKFEKGQVERPVPQILAEWLFRVDQQKVHTVDGEYVQRFGVKDPPESLLTAVGGSIDSSPIEIDKTRVEGWDTDRFAVDRPEQMKTIQLKRNPADYENTATPGGFGRQR